LEVAARPVAEILVLNQTKEPYSGWVKSFHEAGSIKELIHYAQGQRHGHYRSWKIDGTVASIATYQKGKKTGLNPTFGESGQVDSIPMYKDGRLLEPKPSARN
jgi:antitoxin component YwqK of YwqJK toxin-antitoxin module